MLESLPMAVRLAICFLLGAIPFAVLAMRGTGVDILRVGSGNPGFNNVLRYSKWRAVFTLIGDLGKGMLAVLLFYRAGDPMTAAWLYGFAAVLGHCYSPFLRFNGGKGIATSAGVMLVLYPLVAAVCLVYFTIARMIGAKRKWLEAGTLASISAWLLFAALVMATRPQAEALYAAAMAAFVIWRHKKNFANLLHAWRASRERSLGLTAGEER